MLHEITKNARKRPKTPKTIPNQTSNITKFTVEVYYTNMDPLQAKPNPQIDSRCLPSCRRLSPLDKPTVPWVEGCCLHPHQTFSTAFRSTEIGRMEGTGLYWWCLDTGFAFSGREEWRIFCLKLDGFSNRARGWVLLPVFASFSASPSTPQILLSTYLKTKLKGLLKRQLRSISSTMWKSECS